MPQGDDSTLNNTYHAVCSTSCADCDGQDLKSCHLTVTQMQWLCSWQGVVASFGLLRPDSCCGPNLDSCLSECATYPRQLLTSQRKDVALTWSLLVTLSCQHHYQPAKRRSR